MSRTAFVFLAVSISLNPAVGTSGSRFATAETTRWQDGQFIVTTLVTGGQPISADSPSVTFNGFVFNQTTQTTSELVVEIDKRGLDEPPSVERVAEQTNFFTVDGVVKVSPEIENIEMEKTIYLLTVIEDNSPASMVLTDDPIPAIAWLAFAGIVSLTGLSAYALDKCKKVTLSGSADLTDGKLETSFSFENE